MKIEAESCKKLQRGEDCTQDLMGVMRGSKEK
jgi:hypothetical protein